MSISEVKVDPSTLTNSNKNNTWNHFDNQDDRTNNRVESFNLSMKKFVGSARPDIYKAVKALKGFETTATANYNLAKLLDARPKLSRREWHDRERALRTYKDQFIRGKFKCGLTDYLDEIVNMFLFELPKKKADLLEDSDEDLIYDSSDPDSDRGSDIELNDEKRENSDPSDIEDLPTTPTISYQNDRMFELDVLFADDDATASSSAWVQPSLEDLCRSYEEVPGVETQPSISTCQTTVMTETPLFDINNNCINYTSNQLKMIYQSDTPVIDPSSTQNISKKRKRQIDNSVCSVVKKVKNDTNLILCDWCGISFKRINRHRNFCKMKPSDIVQM
jgi:hypothetical protein